MAEDALFGAAEALTLQCRLEEATLLLERRLSQPSVPTRVYHDLSVLYSQQGFFDLALHLYGFLFCHSSASGTFHL